METTKGEEKENLRPWQYQEAALLDKNSPTLGFILQEKINPQLI